MKRLVFDVVVPAFVVSAAFLGVVVGSALLEVVAGSTAFLVVVVDAAAAFFVVVRSSFSHSLLPLSSSPGFNNEHCSIVFLI